LNFLEVCYTKEIGNGAPIEEEDCVKEYKEQKEIITPVQLQLVKKNRIIASLTRKFQDDVPLLIDTISMMFHGTLIKVNWINFYLQT